MSITVRPQAPENGWRQRGYTDGFALRVPRPPKGDASDPCVSAYHGGYRRGAEARAKVEA